MVSRPDSYYLGDKGMKKCIKHLILLFLLLLFSSFILSGCTNIYSKREIEEMQEKYRMEGYSEGYSDGYIEGYNKGEEDSQAIFSDYSAGDVKELYPSVYEKIYENAYIDGYEDRSAELE